MNAPLSKIGARRIEPDLVVTLQAEIEDLKAEVADLRRELSLQADDDQVRRVRTQLRLGDRPARLAIALCQRGGRPLTREQILRRIVPAHVETVSQSYIAIQVRFLRLAIGPESVISGRTMGPGYGYALTPAGLARIREVLG